MVVAMGVSILAGPRPEPSAAPTAAAVLATDGPSRRDRFFEPPPPLKFIALAAGPLELPWFGGTIRLTLPPGWQQPDDASPYECFRTCLAPQGGTTLSRYSLDNDGPLLTLDLDHDVAWVLRGDCGPGARSTDVGRHSIGAGAGGEVVLTALEDWLEPDGGGPPGRAILVGGYPATQLTIDAATSWSGFAPCRSSDGQAIWMNRLSGGLSVPDGAEATVFVVDVDGHPLVITSLARDAAVADRQALDAIVGSMTIILDPTVANAAPRVFPDEGDMAAGRAEASVGGIDFSFEIPRTGPGTTGWISNGVFAVAKSDGNGRRSDERGAAGILWAVPADRYLRPCEAVPEFTDGLTLSDRAEAVTRLATDAVAMAGPTDAAIGGHPAKLVVITLGENAGCAPGFLFTWPSSAYGHIAGPLGRIGPGDTVGVWLVDVDGATLVIEAVTASGASPTLERELQQIVDSIRFATDA
jgi:hypothetical protein